jgi:hypothetical protein
MNQPVPALPLILTFSPAAKNAPRRRNLAPAGGLINLCFKTVQSKKRTDTLQFLLLPGGKNRRQGEGISRQPAGRLTCALRRCGPKKTGLTPLYIIKERLIEKRIGAW